MNRQNANVKKLHGFTSLTYPILAYDTYWVTALSLEKIIDNSTINIDVESLKNIITGTAADYNGISGKIILNDAGDRINENYDIWSVVKSQKDFDNYIWKQDIASTFPQSRK